jgi:putative hemolysin
MRVNLHCLCTRFIWYLQKVTHTALVNGQTKVPSRMAVPANSLLDRSVSGLRSAAGVAALPITQPVFAEPVAPARPRIHAEVGRYRLRLAETVADRDAVCRLRFRVFNIELGKGLEASYETGLDTDHFDLFCEHLLVEDKTVDEDSPRRIVGTYRMQSGETAARNLGYYSEQEFDLRPYEALRGEILELGRASIDREHRTPEVLTLLWRGIAQYATDMQLRYLIGCSSLNSVDPQEGWAMYDQLTNYRVAGEFATEPMAGYECPQPITDSAVQNVDAEAPSDAVKVPKLLKTYLAIGARICSAPAWDREFGTIDFLTLMDLRTISSSARNRFLAPLTQ